MDLTLEQVFKLNPREEHESVAAYARRIQFGNWTDHSIRTEYYKLGLHLGEENLDKRISVKEKEENKFPIESLKKQLLHGEKSLIELSNQFNVPPKVIEYEINNLKDSKYNITENNSLFAIEKGIAPGGKSTLNEKMWQGDMIKIGFTSDNHMCNHHSREDVLNLLYDVFAGEGIATVYNAGNWIDGESRFNKNELFVKGMTGQVEYCAQNYPSRKGITTYFVAGDDHEGWYTQREGVNIGEYLQLKREQLGLDDMKYLGYGEADIELNEGGFENKSWIRLVHPGGGSAYATSYTMQKLVESYQGGEKPNVILAGHYHKLDYAYPREVHAVQTGCTTDQSLFMRKLKIQAMVGGGILEMRRAPDGIINRVKVEFITAFDKKFYIGKDKYFK